MGQLCDGLDQLGGRHQDNGGRVGGQGPQGLVAGVEVTDPSYWAISHLKMAIITAFKDAR